MSNSYTLSIVWYYFLVWFGIFCKFFNGFFHLLLLSSRLFTLLAYAFMIRWLYLLSGFYSSQTAWKLQANQTTFCGEKSDRKFQSCFIFLVRAVFDKSQYFMVWFWFFSQILLCLFVHLFLDFHRMIFPFWYLSANFFYPKL